MSKRILAAMGLGVIMVAGSGWAQQAVPPAAPAVVAVRTAERVAADLQAVAEEQKEMARKEAEIIDGMRAQAPTFTNLVAAAGGDEKLAAKVRKIQELTEQLNTLKAEVRTEMAANPVLQERRANQEKRRTQLMEMAEARRKLESRKRALLDEQAALKAAP